MNVLQTVADVIQMPFASTQSAATFATVNLATTAMGPTVSVRPN